MIFNLREPLFCFIDYAFCFFQHCRFFKYCGSQLIQNPQYSRTSCIYDYTHMLVYILLYETCMYTVLNLFWLGEGDRQSILRIQDENISNCFAFLSNPFGQHFNSTYIGTFIKQACLFNFFPLHDHSTLNELGTNFLCLQVFSTN